MGARQQENLSKIHETLKSGVKACKNRAKIQPAFDGELTVAAAEQDTGPNASSTHVEALCANLRPIMCRRSAFRLIAPTLVGNALETIGAMADDTPHRVSGRQRTQFKSGNSK